MIRGSSPRMTGTGMVQGGAVDAGPAPLTVIAGLDPAIVTAARAAGRSRHDPRVKPADDGDGDGAGRRGRRQSARYVAATNVLRRLPMPVISMSTTSPDLRSGETPSVPIQTTSPG